MDTDRTASTRLTLRRHFRDVAVEFAVVLAVAREGVENGSVASQLGEPSKFITGVGVNHREIVRAAVQRGQNGGLGLWPKHGFHCPLIVFLALAFWTWLWGPIGAFLATPILIIGLVVSKHFLPEEGIEVS